MAMGRREKDIKLLVAKFVELAESLNPGERLSIKKVAAKRQPAAKRRPAAKLQSVAKDRPRRAAVKTASKKPKTKAPR
jgi:hypothetical protein